MARRVALIHPQTGLMKSGFYVFSRRFLFFGWFVPVFRGVLLVGLLHLAITVVTFGIWQFIIAFLDNKQYMTRMLEKADVLNDTEAVNEIARQKLGFQKIYTHCIKRVTSSSRFKGSSSQSSCSF